MTKKTRNIIFILTLGLFFVIAPLILLYSQGIRIEFGRHPPTTPRILRTGGLYLNVLQKSAEIYLDGTLEKKTSILSNSALIRNLLPKKYKIEVKKPGYFSWQKTLEIKEGEVVEAKNILLVKSRAQFEILKKNIENFWVSENGEELLLKENNKEGWRFLLLNLLTLQETEIFSEKDLKGNFEIEIAEWNSQNKEILLQGEGDQAFFVLDYSLSPKKQIFNLVLSNDIKKISFNPGVKGEVLFLEDSNLIKKNFRENQKEEIFLPRIVWFEIQDGNLFWLSDSGFLLKSDINGERREVLNKEPLSLILGENYGIKAWTPPTHQPTVFVLTSDGLYLLTESGKFNKIFEELEGFEIAPDFKKLSFWQEHEIWILKEVEGEKKALFLNRFSRTPESISWLTPYYLLFKIGDEIKITEIDNRDYLNMATLETFNEPEIFFNQRDKKLYVLSKTTLFSSEKLVP